jgi:hypothetical protein
MTPLVELASKIGVPIFFKEEWGQHNKMWDEGISKINKGNRLKDESEFRYRSNRNSQIAKKLLSKANKERYEGRSLQLKSVTFYRNIVKKHCGETHSINWENGEVKV